MQTNNWTRRRLLGTAAKGTAIAALAPMAAACSQIGGSSNTATSGTVEFMAHFTPLGKGPRHAASSKIWDDFKQKYPKITIKWQETAWQTIGEKFMAAWSANTAPDISLFSPANIGPVYALGALADMSPHLKTWSASDQKDFPPAWWNVGTYGKEKIIAPLLLFGDVMAFRKSVFTKAGVDPMQLKTWDEWTAGLQKVVVDGSGKHAGTAGFNPSTVKMWGYATFLGRGTGALPPFWDAMIVEKTGHQDVEPPTWKADSWISDAGIADMQFVTDWVKKYQIQPASTLNMDLGNSMKFFDQSQCAVYNFGTNVYPAARANLQFDKTDIINTLQPSFDGKKAGPVEINHWSMGISNKSKAMDTAFTVLDYWMSPASDLTMAEIGGQQPKRTSTAKNPFFDTPDRSYIRLVNQGIADWAIPLLSPPVRENELLTEAYQNIITQNTPVKQAMQDAYQRYTKLLNQIPPGKLPKA